jgi:hypothetical protein
MAMYASCVTPAQPGIKLLAIKGVLPDPRYLDEYDVLAWDIHQGETPVPITYAYKVESDLEYGIEHPDGTVWFWADEYRCLELRDRDELLEYLEDRDAENRKLAAEWHNMPNQDNSIKPRRHKFTVRHVDGAGAPIIEYWDKNGRCMEFSGWLRFIDRMNRSWTNEEESA